jgi:cyclophilin family peptidyl-prolyl cis-trans isomerase
MNLINSKEIVKNKDVGSSLNENIQCLPNIGCLKNTIIKILLLIIISFSILPSGCVKKKYTGKVQNSNDSTDDISKGNPNKLQKKLKMELEIDTVYVTNYAVILTSMGKIVIGLYGNDAPKTVENFIGLVKKGYYNGILIHRVSKDFLIQMGDRNTLLSRKKADWGKGGQSFSGNPFEDELNAAKPSFKNGYVKGTIAMANRGPNTNTSQFFICLDDAIDLEKKWAIFGRVIDGMDVVYKINYLPVIPGPFEKNDGLPKEPVKIYSIYLEK